MGRVHRFFSVLFFFALAIGLIHAEPEAGLLYRFSWAGDGYVLRYEVVIEKEEDGSFQTLLRESSYEPFIQIALPVGNYRMRIIPFDFRDLPGAGSPWRYFRVFALITHDPSAVPQFALEDVTGMQLQRYSDTFVSFGFECLGFSLSSVALGGSLTFGRNINGMGFGLAAFFAGDIDADLISVKTAVFFRYYFSRNRNNLGPFAQVEAGLALFGFEQSPFADYLSPTAGLTLGWRFPLGERFFAETAVRAGYPYVFGAGLSAGVRF